MSDFLLLAFLFLVQPQLLLMGWQTLALHLGSHALFLHNLLADTHGSINGPNWSVALEMQFYLLMLLAGPWLVRQRVAVDMTGVGAVAGVAGVVGQQQQQQQPSAPPAGPVGRVGPLPSVTDEDAPLLDI